MGVYGFKNRKKERKKSVNIYSDLSYHLYLSFGWGLNHILGRNKCICIIRQEGIVRVLIGSLSMCVEVQMRRRQCICPCLSSIWRFFIRRYQLFLAVIKISNNMERGIAKYGLQWQSSLSWPCLCSSLISVSIIISFV